MKIYIPENTRVQAGRYHDIMSRQFLYWTAHKFWIEGITRTGGLNAFTSSIFHPHVQLRDEWGEELLVPEDWVERAFDDDGSWITHIKRFVSTPPKKAPYRTNYDRLLIADLHFKIVGNPIVRKPITLPA
ncbi:MAG TPA: hypothetical protein EYG57_07000 [Planctomycetes bacterium]|uniref:hypothetical protein n=1 Tax=Henriciella sp. TaxID=1968823 RepID=UPI0017D9AA54|nr:hypothetical protein [Henriciella sp.]HIG21768.1 hypothetical protein [Henriciella sp.]HIM29288.1 hypothetical protein [Planctomycetota bacterium]